MGAHLGSSRLELAFLDQLLVADHVAGEALGGAGDAVDDSPRSGLFVGHVVFLRCWGVRDGPARPLRELTPNRSGDDPAVALARRLAEHGISRYENGLDGWPCGLPGGFAPGLLDGHAGIALFYLRIGDRRVASPLLITAPPA